MVKNPIVGLAFVVTSQQEMLEAKQQEIEGLQNDLSSQMRKYNELQKSTDDLIAKIELEAENARHDASLDIASLQDELEKTRQQVKSYQEKLQNAQDQAEYFSGAYNMVNHELLNIKVQQEEFSKRYGWRKWTPETEYDVDRYGNVPMVEGMYRYADDSKEVFYDNVLRREHSMAGKYNINGVNTPYDSELQQRGKFRVEPFSSFVNDGATLVAVRINYIDELVLLDDFKMPEEE